MVPLTSDLIALLADEMAANQLPTSQLLDLDFRGERFTQRSHGGSNTSPPEGIDDLMPEGTATHLRSVISSLPASVAESEMLKGMAPFDKSM